MRTWFLLGAALTVGSCGFVHDETLDGPYRLVAVDVFEQMAICHELEGGNCVGRIPPTVVQSGFDERYIVGASQDEEGDRPLAYYYIIRATDGPNVDPSISVRGPFTAAEFASESSRLRLPHLSPVAL